ncbi:MAG: hypothetical protein ACRC2T_09895 [Thermoguttaceae bacterium]
MKYALKLFCLCSFGVIIFCCCVIAANAAEVVFDFEAGDLQGWEIVEGKFDRIVSDRELFHNTYPEVPDRKYNKQGKYYLSTVEQQPGMPSADSMTGILHSPVFVLEKPQVSFLIGGGDWPKTYLAICSLKENSDVNKNGVTDELENGITLEIENETVLARGVKTEILRRVEIDLPDYVGKKCFLRVVDLESGSWGYIAFDDFHAEGRIDNDATKKLRDSLKAILEKQRQAELARIKIPQMTKQPILFVTRHYYESKYHAIDTLFNSDEYNVDFNCEHKSFFSPGAALKLLDVDTGKVTTLLETQTGCIRDPDVHFDGDKIIFSMRENRDTDYKIWEMTLEKIVQTDEITNQKIEKNNDENKNVKTEYVPGKLTQLTFAEGVADFDPIYLPDGSIVFSSTREPKYNMCSRDISSDLYRMESDGANIVQITKNTLFEHNPTLLDDGRILYHRWEYVDRNFGDAHAAWTVNPDGTNQSIYWGNNTADPGAVYNPKQIPNTPLMLCIFGPHHDREYGALAIVDRRLGVDGKEPVIRTWPSEFRDRVRTTGPFDCDSPTGSVSIKYEDPWPLDESHFLCSRQITPGGEMGIFLIDLEGNELLVHHESPGCFDAMPLAPHKRPPVTAVRRTFDDSPGFVQITNVYEGTHMQDVQPGSVKWLRIVESPEKRHWSPGLWFGQGYTAPGMNWHSLENKRILGTVPVEADGSVSFSVPSDKFIYFQLLDENGMMIQSMRSGTVLQPNEMISCTGCHEDRLATPQIANKTPLAFLRQPSEIQDWYGNPRDFSFTVEVQPVFDKYCVECHDYDKPAGEKLNLCKDRDFVFNTAYTELWKKGFVKGIGAGPAELLPAYFWGSHKSPLIQELRDPKVPEHKDLKLSAEDMDRLITWCDMNGVYYPTYSSANPASHTGRTPLTREQLDRLSQLLGRNFPSEFSFNSPGVSVSFDRPEKSPALRHLDKDSPEYKEAVEILQAGKSRIEMTPEADMPGFVPCAKDKEREAKYAFRREVEMRFRNAIENGEKLYDAPTGYPVSRP